MWWVQVVDVKNREAVGKPRCFAQRWQAVRYGLRCGIVPPGYELALWEQEEQAGAWVRYCGCVCCPDCVPALEAFRDALEQRWGEEGGGA
jgi:hypothetical protein